MQTTTKSIPKTTEENLLVEKVNHRENYRFYGFDNSMDETSYCSGENLKSLGNVKFSGSYLFNEQLNGFKKSTSNVATETVSKSEANLKNL